VWLYHEENEILTVNIFFGVVIWHKLSERKIIKRQIASVFIELRMKTCRTQIDGLLRGFIM